MGLTRLPVNNPVISQPFGANPTRYLPASHPLIRAYGNYQPYGHDGVDFACPIGTPVYAPGPGVVAFSGFGRDMPYHICIKYGFSTVQSAKWASGLIVILDHGGFATYTAHMNRTDLDHRVGQWIPAGTLLGLSGDTGRSGGPHVHWSAVTLPVNYSDGLYSRRNPLDFVTVRTVTPIRPGPAKGDPTSNPEDWFSMADKNDLKNALREVVSEPAILDKIAMAILKRDCYLVDPTGKTGEIVGTTDLATKINWDAHNYAEILREVKQVGATLDDHIAQSEAAPASAVKSAEEVTEAK